MVKTNLGFILMTINIAIGVSPSFSIEVKSVTNTSINLDHKMNTKESAESKKAMNMELDTNSIEKNINKKSQFNRSSADQKSINVKLANNQEKYDDLSFSHIEKLEECKSKESIDLINKCRIDYMKTKSVKLK